MIYAMYFINMHIVLLITSVSSVIDNSNFLRGKMLEVPDSIADFGALQVPRMFLARESIVRMSILKKMARKFAGLPVYIYLP